MGVVLVDARTARYLACTDAESLVTLHQEMLTPHGFRCFIYATNPIAAEFGKTAHAITAGYTVSLPRRHHAANAEFGLIGAEHMTQGALIDIWGEYGANIFAYCHLFSSMRHCAARLATFADPYRTTARSIGIGDQGTHHARNRLRHGVKCNNG